MTNETNSTSRRWRVTRRGFLIGAGATAAALAIGIPAGLPWARLQIAGQIDGLRRRAAHQLPDRPLRLV